MNALLLTLLLQTAPEPPPPPAPSPEAPAVVDPELARALAADTQASPPPATPVATSAPTAASGFSLNPDLSVIIDAAAAAFSRDNPREDGGHDPNQNGFTLQQLELALGKAVDPYFRLDAYIVFKTDAVEVEEAYATTTSLPFNLQMRAGQFLTRFGRQNPTHPHTWDFVDQPFMWSRVFGGDGDRGVGAELSWLAPLPWYVEAIASANSATGADTARSFLGSVDRPPSSPRDIAYVGALRQFFPLSDTYSLLWGLSSAFGPNPTSKRNETSIYGTDLYLKFRPLTDGSFTIVSLQAEALYRRRQIPDDVLHDYGGYAQLFWRWAQRWAVGARYEYGSQIWNQDGNVATNDYLDPLWLGHRQRVTGAVTFWPTEFSRLRLQGSMDKISEESKPVWGAMLALEVLAGAHGAHAF